MRTVFIILISVVLISCNSRNSKSTDFSSVSVSDSIENVQLVVDFNKPTGITLYVDKVELADSLLRTYAVKSILENKIGKEIIFFPEEHKNYGLVYCPNNGLIQTIQECYDNHRPLIISPDIIWLTICQGVSIHINENFDSLETVIFKDNKPDIIIVRNDSLGFGAIHWAELISSFSNETKKYTKDDYYSFYVSEFSTTTGIEKTAYQIALLESYEKAFKYVGDTGCGIPSITITGEKADWISILSKLEKLDDIGLSNWGANLKPVIQEFINVFDNKINMGFWQDIYKNASEYAAFSISGWIIKFFPYIKELEADGVYDSDQDASKIYEVFKPNVFLDGNNYLLSTLSTDNFPSGISKIDISWNNYIKDEKKDIEVYAGFFAIKQYLDKTLEPFISWAIAEKKSEKSSHKFDSYADLELNHKHEYWSPHIASEICDSAIYDIHNFTSQQKSLNYIKSLLIDSISLNLELRKVNFTGNTLELVILSNGTIGKVSLLGNKSNVIYENYFKQQLDHLPMKWFPALAHPLSLLDLWDFSDEDNKLKIRANSLVKIELEKFDSLIIAKNLENRTKYSIISEKIDSIQYFVTKQRSEKIDENFVKVTKLKEVKKILKGIVEFVDNHDGNLAVKTITSRNGMKSINLSESICDFIAYYPEEDILLCEGGHGCDVSFNLKNGKETDEIGNPNLIMTSPKKEFRLNGCFGGQECYSYFIQRRINNEYFKIIKLDEEFEKSSRGALCLIYDSFWSDENTLFLTRAYFVENGLSKDYY